ncbi:MAG: dicarboxylate/amino acid:cation symporter [Chlamydiales bacterium]|nr:dicarboxylate/amino acid:cation symporter [Chlamydiales bacterium]
MKRIFGNFLLFAAMAAGLLTGWAHIPLLNETAHVVSDLFLRLLKLISLPIIFLAVTSTITGMKSFHEMRRMGRKVLTYTLGTTLVAAAVALLLYVLIDPAASAQAVEGGGVPETVKQASYFSFVLNIIPSNFFGAFTEGNVMGIVFVALFLSVSILFLPDEQKNFLNKLFSSLFAAMIKMTGFVIKLMPIAIWAFMVLLVKDLQDNYAHFSRIMLYIACVVSANLIQGIIVLPLFLKIKKVSPLKTFRGMAKALAVAFFSKSSNATLPVSMRCAEENLGVKQRVSNFSLPLCSVVNMNGCAAFILTTVLFVSTVNGLTFSTFDLVSWIFIATFAAIGNAGVPMGCFFLTSAFLIGMDVPLYMMGLILPFYTILDMIETTLNIWSDSCITVAVDKDLSEADLPVSEASKEAA